MNKTSIKRLESVYEDLADVIYAVDSRYPLLVIEGHRSAERQNKLYLAKRSKVQYPDSKHNYFKSMAVDVSPTPIPHEWGKKWIDRVKYYEMYALINYEAKRRNIVTRWGGDWDSDHDYRDQTFNDLVHVELVSVRGVPIKNLATLA